MQASLEQQQELLSLGALDIEIAKLRRSISEAMSSKSTDELRVKQLELASALVDARGKFDTVELETKRAAEDLATVEARIHRDNERLLSTSSSKDAQGIQHELETLMRRKSELEDLELGLMDDVDSARAVLDEIAGKKSVVDADLAALLDQQESEILKLRSGLDLVQTKRAQQASRIDAELIVVYDKKSTRGIAVSRLNGNECGACRMNIGATALNEINALPKEQLPTCPDCQAILIR
jgi:predicted  nucleic acid-binding Zn-ribbon protein